MTRVVFDPGAVAHWTILDDSGQFLGGCQTVTSLRREYPEIKIPEAEWVKFLADVSRRHGGVIGVEEGDVEETLRRLSAKLKTSMDDGPPLPHLGHFGTLAILSPSEATLAYRLLFGDCRR